MNAPQDETTTTGGGPDLPAGGVLAAVDGSESAAHALAWAVAEAQARQVGLTIAHSYHWPSSGLGAMEAAGFLMDALEQDSAEVLSAAAEAAKKLAPDLTVHTVSRLGPPVPTLVKLSEGRDLIVVGSRGLGGFAGMLLGSVGTGLVADAHCPVAVVRGERAPERTDPVVVGVDGAPASSDVLREAFAAAARRGCPLIAVHAWQDPTADMRAARGKADGEQQESWQRSVSDDLAQRIAEVGKDFASVQVQAVTSSQRPAAALLEQAKTAQLVVVGTRGRGDITGLLLGSTSRSLVQHAPCPVMVVR